MSDLKNKKIAIIIPDFDNGGEEHRAVFFANSYLEYFQEVFVIAPEGLSSVKLSDKVKHLTVNVRNPKHIITVLKLLKKHNITYLQGHKRATLPYLFLAEKLLGVTSLFNFDNIYLNYNRICSYISPRYIAYLSDVLKDFYSQIYSSRRFNNVTINMGGTFYQPQLTDKVEETRKKLNIENKFVILSLGRLDNQKNHHLLLQALSRIKRSDYVCLVAGDGILRAELMQTAQDLELSSEVRFLGHRTDIEDLLNVADVLVQSSIFEGFPNVFIEAASVGLPIIATNVGSSKTLVQNNGILVESNDVDGLAKAIEMLADNYSSYKEQAVSLSGDSFFKKFHRDEMLNNYIGFYKQFS